MEGFIRLYRSFFNNPLWNERREFSRAEAWLDLIQLAQYCDTVVVVKSRMIELQRGQLVGSRRFFEERWQWSNSKVDNYLKILELQNMIKRTNANKITIVTLCNFDIYNTYEGGETPIKRQSNANRTPVKRQYKEGKEYSSLSLDASEAKNLETSINPEPVSPMPPGCAAPPKANELPMTELREMYIRKGEPKAESVMRAVPTVCKSTADVWQLLDRFVNEQIGKDITHKTWSDFQSHFINWIKYQNNGKQQYSTGRSNPTKRDMQGVRDHLAKSINPAQAEFERGMAAVGEPYAASTESAE